MRFLLALIILVAVIALLLGPPFLLLCDLTLVSLSGSACTSIEWNWFYVLVCTVWYFLWARLIKQLYNNY